jgi:hypothetical protein
MRCGGSGSGCGTCEILGILPGLRKNDAVDLVGAFVDGAVGMDGDVWIHGSAQVLHKMGCGGCGFRQFWLIVSRFGSLWTGFA